MKGLVSRWQSLFRPDVKYSVASLLGIFFAGVVFWGGFNWSMELTNTEEFCISCHVMKAFPYKEYKETGHYSNRTGVRASCPDCHVPKEWVYKVIRKVGATNELLHWALGSVDTREKFEAKRPELAQHVWDVMKSTDSRECRNCHGIDWMAEESQTPTASLMHSLAVKWGKTCIDCHKGVAHQLPRGFDKNVLMDELHGRMKEDKIECRICHTEMAGPPKGQDW